MQEMHGTWVWSMSQEDPLQKEMATHFSIFAMDRKFHGQRSPAGTVHGAAKNWTRLSAHTQPSHWLKKSSFPAWGLEHMNTYEQKAHWALELFPQTTLQTNHRKTVIWTTNFPDYLLGFYATPPSHSAGPFPRSSLCQLLGTLHQRSLLWVWVSCFSISASLLALTRPCSVLRKLSSSFCNRPALYVTHIFITIHLVDNFLS